MNNELSDFLHKQAEYVFEPEKWARDILGFQARRWQKQAFIDYIEHRKCAWSTGSGVGKSALLSIITLHFLSCRPFPKIPCTAPTQHQLYDVLWAEINKWLRRSALLSKYFKWTQTKVSLLGHEEEWFAVARTSRPKPGANTVEGLQGFHADHILFCLDEASGVPDQVVGAVEGALSSVESYIIMASNPTRNSGYFFKAVCDEKQKGVWATQFVNAEEVEDVDPNYIRRLASIYGDDSDYYRMRVKGLPPRNESTALITPEQVYSAHLRNIPAEGDVTISCDPARFGDDDTVFYVRHGSRFIERHKFHGMDTRQTSDFGINLFHQYNPARYTIDSIGIGAGIVDNTKRELGALKGRVDPINVGEKAKHDQLYYNLRMEMFWELRSSIDNVSIPFDTPLLDEELLAIRYGWDPKDKRMQLESKDSTKARLGRSPNDADSIALNLYNSKIIVVSRKYFQVGHSNVVMLNMNRKSAPSHDEVPSDGNIKEKATLRNFNVFGTKNLVGSRRYRELGQGSSSKFNI